MAAQSLTGPLRLDRARLAAFTGILAGLNAISFRLLAGYLQDGFAVTLVRLGDVSAGVWFALAGCYLIAREDGAAEPARRGDLLVAAAAFLAALLPAAELASAALLGCGLYFVLTSRPRSRARRVGVVVLAVSGALIIGKLMLTLFAPLLLPIDAAAVAALAGTSADGNIVGFSNGKAFLIASGCSSVHNLTFGLLVWATLVQMLGLRLTPRLLAVGLLAMAATVLVNICRLVAIARMPQHFHYLHLGEGAALFGWATLLIGAGIVFMGAYGEARRQL